MFDDINIYFAVIYFVCLILFTVYTFIAFATQSPSDKSAMVLATTLNPLIINITTTCSIPYQCGIWKKNPDGSMTLTNPMTISSRWNSVQQNSPCFGTSATISQTQNQMSAIITVCYSPSPNDGVVLTIPFNSTAAVLTVNVISPSNQYTNSLYEQLPINALQWKTVFLSQVDMFLELLEIEISHST